MNIIYNYLIIIILQKKTYRGYTKGIRLVNLNVCILILFMI